MQPRPVCIVIPFHRDPSLPSQLLQSLRRCGDELRNLNCTLIAINDAPEDRAVETVLRDELEQLQELIPCSLIRNRENLGFLKSANIGLDHATSKGLDCILLNSDTVVFPGALKELHGAAYVDSAIGFVSPRSNNATICSLPHQDQHIPRSPAEAYAAYERLVHFLPRVQIVPTVVGFCIYVKHDVLQQCGIFDEIYGRGYNEENDLIMRANQKGYCAAIANWAFVYHRGRGSFNDEAAALELRNAGILDERYPQYRQSVNAYFVGSLYRAELLLCPLHPRGAKLRVAIIGDTKELAGILPGLNETYEVLTASSVELGSTFAAIVAVNPSWEIALRAATLAPVNLFVLTGVEDFDRLESRADTQQAWRLIFRTADAVCAWDPSRFLLRLPLEQTLEVVETLPDVLDRAIAKCSTIRIAERLMLAPGHAAVDSKDRRIQDLEASLSWRVTAPFRRMAELLGVRTGSEHS